MTDNGVREKGDLQQRVIGWTRILGGDTASVVVLRALPTELLGPTLIFMCNFKAFIICSYCVCMVHILH